MSMVVLVIWSNVDLDVGDDANVGLVCIDEIRLRILYNSAAEARHDCGVDIVAVQSARPDPDKSSP